MSNNVFGEVRFSYANVWEPKGFAGQENSRKTYNVRCMIPKSNAPLIDQVLAAEKAAIDEGLSKKLFTEAVSKSAKFRRCVFDGDAYADEVTDGSRDECRGHMFFNAKAQEDRQPGIVDKKANPIMQRDDFYSGCWGYVNGNFYSYNSNGGIGVTFGMNNLMKTRDDERLDGRQSAEQAFAAIVANEDDDDSALM